MTCPSTASGRSRKKATRQRGERRYVLVSDLRDGREYRVLTSVAGAGFAMIEYVPSNEDLAGKYRGMMLTHGNIIKGVVFQDEAEANSYILNGRKLEARQGVLEHHRTTYYSATVREEPAA